MHLSNTTLYSLLTAALVSLALLRGSATAGAAVGVEEPGACTHPLPPLAPDSVADFKLGFDFAPEDAELSMFDLDNRLDSICEELSVKLPEGRFYTLTDDDYREVAEELGVETAAIKAVVDIEAGRSHQGFWSPGKPLINFDLTMYRKFAPRHGVSLKKAQKSAPVIFARPNTKRYGSYQAAQQARLDAACNIDRQSALESTFWGMFQIGGFNWRKCGAESVEDFVNLMSRSERDQLELFARFIANNGMLDDIRNKRWLKFALKYNGPKAKSRGYHTRLAASYKRHKAAEK